MSATQAMIEPQPTPSIPSPDAIPSINAPSPSANADEDAALARLADDGAPPSETPVVPPAATLSLEERVRRLEDALAVLQEKREQAPPLASSAPLAAPASTAVLLDVGKRLLGTAAQVVPPLLSPVSNVAPPLARSGVLWLLWDTWAEARAIVRMFVDPRYHLPWSARVLPLVVLAAILTSTFWVPGSSILIFGDLLVKLIDLILAFLLFKWLGHEARRYRQTSPDLPANLRL